MQKIVLTLFSFFYFFTFSQKIEISWSEKFRNSFSKFGCFQSYAGENQEYVYAVFNRGNKKYLISFEKNEMHREVSSKIQNFKTNLANLIRLNKLHFQKAVITKEKIYVFWIQTMYYNFYKKEIVYVTTYDKNLNKLEKQRKLYEYENSTINLSYKSSVSSSIFILDNSSIGNKIIIGHEKINGPRNQLIYKTYDENLNELSSNLYELPFHYYDPTKLNFTYEYINDGVFLVKYYTPVTYVEHLIEKLKKFRFVDNIFPNKCVFALVINSLIGVGKHINLSTNDFLFQDVKTSLSKNRIHLFGAYYDFINNPFGDSVTGIYQYGINTNNFETTVDRFIPFSKVTINNLYGSDTIKSESTLFYRYLIGGKQLYNNISTLDNGLSPNDSNLIVAFSNTFYTDLDAYSADNPTYTQKSFYKRNINLLNINQKGEIEWSKEIKRHASYYKNLKNDLIFLKKDTSFLLIYGDNDFLDKYKFVAQFDEKYYFNCSEISYKTGLFKSEFYELENKMFDLSKTYNTSKNVYLYGNKKSIYPLYFSTFLGRIKF